jgi:hypothetical protein
MGNRASLILLLLSCTASLSGQSTTAPLAQRCRDGLDRAVAFFQSISTQGGYVYYVTPDLSQRWGEGVADEHTIEVQPPGTPAVGQTFLRVYEVTGSRPALTAALDAAHALIRGQNALGGWQHTIRFDRKPGRSVSFDDDQTQGAISFLMALDRHVDDEALSAGIERALDMMLEAQLADGGWPHVYPEQGNYHDYATFNDEGINDCIRVMTEAHRFYQKSEYRQSLDRAGRYLMISQLPPPQPGWAQQYNAYLQPAWARAFEPPSVCPSVTVNNINTLMDLTLYTGREGYLEAIPDAVRWLEEIRLPNGKWARFVELYTNNALYYDRGRKRVDSTEELHIERRTGYGYEVDLSHRLAAAKRRFAEIQDLGVDGYLEKNNQALSTQDRENRAKHLVPRVETLLGELDDQGCWLSRRDRYKKIVPGKLWNGEYEEQDRISSAVFNRNARVLCEYLEMVGHE